MLSFKFPVILNYGIVQNHRKFKTIKTKHEQEPDDSHSLESQEV